MIYRKLLNIKSVIKNFLIKKFLYVCALIISILFIVKSYTSFLGIFLVTLFFVFICLAKYYEKWKMKKYVFVMLSMIFSILSLLVAHIDFDYIAKFVFLIPILYAYFLRDFFSANIVAIGIIYVFFTYRFEIGSERLFSISMGMIITAVSQTIIANGLKKIMEERNKFLEASITDSLTHLNTLEYVLKNGQEYIEKENEVAVCVIDIDYFKDINDTYGHLKGNKIIVQVSQTLRKQVANLECTVGRLGGDEFIILLEDISETELDNFDKELRKALDEQNYWIDSDFENIKISTSIGIAHRKSKNITKIEELLQEADMQMYANKVQRHNKVLSEDKLHDSIIYSRLIPEAGKRILKVLSEKDMYTYMHSKYTAKYAYELAKALKLSSDIVNGLYIAGWLHDVGKMLVSNDILRKPGALTDEEYNIVKEHVNIGIKMISILEIPNCNEIVTKGIKYHHERWDGKGYPSGISGNNTPLEGRILQIADVFSAMTVKRVYRETLSLNDAINEMNSNAGTQFDSELVSVFTSYLIEKDLLQNIV